MLIPVCNISYSGRLGLTAQRVQPGFMLTIRATGDEVATGGERGEMRLLDMQKPPRHKRFSFHGRSFRVGLQRSGSRSCLEPSLFP